MGDYTLGHFSFALKPKTPQDVIDAIEALLDYNQYKVIDWSKYEHKFFRHDRKFMLGSSAYHSEPTYSTSESGGRNPADDYAGRPGASRIYKFQGQIKYGHEEFIDFADWVGPHCIVDNENKGFIGYMFSEYTDTHTSFVVQP